MSFPIQLLINKTNNIMLPGFLPGVTIQFNRNIIRSIINFVDDRYFIRVNNIAIYL